MQAKHVAVVFPGQGAQRPAMGKDFAAQLSVSRQTFEEAADTLGWDVAAVCFGQDERLDLTEYTQPCLLTTEIAMLRGLRERYGFTPTYFGGHSLGEFTALVAAAVLPFPDALRIVQLRGRLMQQAVPVGVGAMTAVIGENLAGELLLQALAGLPVDVANFNSPHQVVISGKADARAAAEVSIRAALDSQELRFVSLNVSAPFHSRFMSVIEAPFGAALAELANAMDASYASRVTSNYTGRFHEEQPAAILAALVHQLSNPVRWQDNMAALTECAAAIYEVGPARPLREFFKATERQCTSITTYRAAESHFQAGGQ